MRFYMIANDPAFRFLIITQYIRYRKEIERNGSLDKRLIKKKWITATVYDIRIKHHRYPVQISEL